MDQWTVTVLGDGGVGKTALAVQQFTLNCFTYDPTEDGAYRKQFIVDNRMCFVEVIDTEGQEEYATLRDQWVREGQGFLLVYSIASRSTFDRLEVFRQSVRRVKSGDPVLMLVGNQCDKAYEREVSKEEGAALARQFGCEFIETSGKTAQNVERAFTILVRTLRKTRNLEPGGAANPLQPRERRRSVLSCRGLFLGSLERRCRSEGGLRAQCNSVHGLRCYVSKPGMCENCEDYPGEFEAMS
ncbi:ras family-domain-containing protein [Mycena sp. CBHHK59/15]|nr:ras family-domain-containing protein [Mycena sp. CBHHK59/15]